MGKVKIKTKRKKAFKWVRMLRIDGYWRCNCEYFTSDELSHCQNCGLRQSISRPKKKRSITQFFRRKPVASLKPAIQPDNWIYKKKQLTRRMKAHRKHMGKLEFQRKKILGKQSMDPAVQNKLLNALEAASKATQTMMEKCQRGLDAIALLQWQNLWLPVVARLRNLQSENECDLALAEIERLEQKAKSITKPIEEIIQGVKDLENIRTEVSERRSFLIDQALIKSTYKLVEGITPIGDEAIAFSTENTFASIQLEDFSWFHDPLDLGTETRELESELYRLQAELDIEGEFSFKPKRKTKA